MGCGPNLVRQRVIAKLAGYAQPPPPATYDKPSGALHRVVIEGCTWENVCDLRRAVPSLVFTVETNR